MNPLQFNHVRKLRWKGHQKVSKEPVQRTSVEAMRAANKAKIERVWRERFAAVREYCSTRPGATSFDVGHALGLSEHVAKTTMYRLKAEWREQDRIAKHEARSAAKTDWP